MEICPGAFQLFLHPPKKSVYVFEENRNYPRFIPFFLLLFRQAAVAVQLLEPTAGSQSCRPPVSRAKGLGSRNQ
jgi:hypothetical protein